MQVGIASDHVGIQHHTLVTFPHRPKIQIIRILEQHQAFFSGGRYRRFLRQECLSTHAHWPNSATLLWKAKVANTIMTYSTHCDGTRNIQVHSGPDPVHEVGGGAISVIFRSQVLLRGLFSDLYKILVNKVTFVGFKGGAVAAPIATPPWIPPWVH